MEQSSSYVAILKRAYPAFSSMVRALPTTRRVNVLLSRHTTFRFRVVTGQTHEDILIHLYSKVDEDHPDEYEWGEEPELDSYIRESYIHLYGTGLTGLALGRKRDEYKGRYELELAVDVFEKEGPWYLAQYYELAKAFYKAPGLTETAYDLFERLGIKTGLVYCTGIPDRTTLMEKLTDAASMSESNYHWLVGSKVVAGGPGSIRLTCACMTLVKYFNASRSVSEFRKGFTSMFEYYVTNCLGQFTNVQVTQEGTVRQFCFAIFNTLMGGADSDWMQYYPDFDPRDHVNYYSKAIIYALEVYGLTLDDITRDTKRAAGMAGLRRPMKGQWAGEEWVLELLFPTNM